MFKRDDLGLPAVARSDPFGPPAKSRKVACLHCGRVYESDLMRWNPVTETWDCAHLDCDGAGYGFDIHEDWIGATG